MTTIGWPWKPKIPVAKVSLLALCTELCPSVWTDLDSKIPKSSTNDWYYRWIEEVCSRDIPWRSDIGDFGHPIWQWVKTLVPLVNIKIAGKWMFIPSGAPPCSFPCLSFPCCRTWAISSASPVHWFWLILIITNFSRLTMIPLIPIKSH